MEGGKGFTPGIFTRNVPQFCFLGNEVQHWATKYSGISANLINMSQRWLTFLNNFSEYRWTRTWTLLKLLLIEKFWLMLMSTPYHRIVFQIGSDQWIVKYFGILVTKPSILYMLYARFWIDGIHSCGRINWTPRKMDTLFRFNSARLSI